jgi:hypothetical protein
MGGGPGISIALPPDDLMDVPAVSRLDVSAGSESTTAVEMAYGKPSSIADPPITDDVPIPAATTGELGFPDEGVIMGVQSPSSVVSQQCIKRTRRCSRC